MAKKRSKKWSTTAKVAAAAIGIAGLIGLAALISRGAKGTTIKSSSGAGGTITSPMASGSDPTVTANYGDNVVFQISANAGYDIYSIVVDGTAISYSDPRYVGSMTSGTFTFSDVTTSHTLAVTFILSTETINYTVGAGGNVTVVSS